MNKLDDVSSSILSNCSSYNEIDDVAFADIIINDDSDKVDETWKMFLWETMVNYSRQKELFSADSGPIHVKNTSLNDHLSPLNSIFIFRQVTGQNIDHLSYTECN